MRLPRGDEAAMSPVGIATLPAEATLNAERKAMVLNIMMLLSGMTVEC